MSDKRLQIIVAAVELVSLHGVKRTSMADVAARANVSRQTLYANFSNKDDLLAEAMRYVFRQIKSALAKDWEGKITLEKALDVYLQHAVFMPFQLIETAPDLIDLVHGVGERTTEVATQQHQEKVEMLTEKLKPYCSKLAKTETDPSAIARLVVTTTADMLTTSSSINEIKALTKTLKQAVVALIES